MIQLVFLSGCTQHHTQKDLAHALWNLDQKRIAELLTAQIDPYKLSIQDMKHIPAGISNEKISPYAFILEGYLDRVYMLEDIGSIKHALDQTYRCIILLITQGVSVDAGFVTIGTQSSMRTFVTQAINRLLQEQQEDPTFDEEGIYALSLWKKIEKTIHTYQPCNQL